MAGHSKWANIQHRKKAQDAKRGKLFTKLIREIVVAAKMGGADQEANPRLRAAVIKALAGNMKRDVVDRAIQRGAGGDEGANMEELVYEGYGPGGTAVLVECLTDNKNRTVAEVRHAFSKAGGNLGTSGSVAYMFSKVGQLVYPEADEDAVMEAALESGAEDVVGHDDGSVEVTTAPENFLEVKDAIDALGVEAVHAEVSMEAETKADLDVDTAAKVLRLVDALEDLDDTQNVHHNADIPEEAHEQME